MTVNWLLDGQMFDAYRDELANCIRQQGHGLALINAPSPPYRWGDVGDAYRNAFPEDSCVVCHGDIELVTRVQREGLWTPGAFATVERYTCSSYYCKFGKWLLGREYIMLPFGELPRCKDFLFATLGVNGRIFVRPDSPLKLFAGQVVTHEEFEADFEFMAFYDFPPSSIVVVSRPQEIEAEWRFVIVNHSIVAGCLYRQNGKQQPQAGYAADAASLAAEIASFDYQPDPVWIMDICRTSSGSVHLLEIGGFSFADLYACDKAAIVEHVSKAALAEWQKGQA
jgi:hypothetical protein